MIYHCLLRWAFFSSNFYHFILPPPTVKKTHYCNINIQHDANTNGQFINCPYNLVGNGVLDVPQTTKTWQYDDSTWSDLLTNFNGESITYDEIGNPLTIGSKELSWTGRQLQSITDGDSEIAYTYNGEGLRTSKTVNGETTNYYYNGSILAGQKTDDDTLVFMYDNNSDIFGVICNDTEYYYIKNAQNDVIAIADTHGVVLVRYEYDAWGKVISITDKDGNPIDDSVGNGVLDVPSNTAEPTTADETATVDESVSLTTVDPQIAQIAHLNPILYRSYYYDKETEWYYLNTRYYSPDMCRFVSADNTDVLEVDQDHLNENNLFVYCLNNPINMADDTGELAWFVAAAISGAAFDTAAYLIGSAIRGEKITWSGVGKAALTGAITGVAFGAVGKIATKAFKAARIAVKASKVAKSSKTAAKVSKAVKPIAGKIRGYTKHGLAQAIGRDGGRGVKASAILDTVRNPLSSTPQKGGTIKYIGKQAVVILNSKGQVVTTYAKSSKYWR